MSKEESAKEKKDLESYFNQSMFVDRLLRPEGSNIAPKTDSYSYLTTGYKYNCSRYGVEDFDVTSLQVYDLTGAIQGTFHIYEGKDYNYYWDNEKLKQTYCKSIMRFTMLDNGNFESKVSIQDKDNVVVNTSVDVIRDVTGCNFDGKSVRDGLFSGLSHENCSGKFEFNECYKVIANGTRLLHYSLSSDFFEVYELPRGWGVEDGVTKLSCPKVFDDINFDKEDNDLEEINVILASRTNNKGKSLVKKINNSK